MKNILVLTDFSENASHSAKVAVILGEKLKANLFIVHHLAGIPVTPNYIGGGFVAEEASWLVEEGKKNFHQLEETLRPVIERIAPPGHRPAIHTLLTEGDIAENIAEIVRRQAIELIVMGAKTGTGLDHILTGSETRAVIDHVSRPVLIIPQTAGIRKLEKVVFATDFNESDIHAVHYLAGLARSIKFKLEIVHVSLFGIDESDKDAQEMNFVQQVAKLKFSAIVYRDVRGKDVASRLNRLCEEAKADVLAMVHYPHSFLSRLVHDSPTHKALNQQNMPLLILPAKII
jgi:nucleotide-binding universal stress UspA family protein